MITRCLHPVCAGWPLIIKLVTRENKYLLLDRLPESLSLSLSLSESLCVWGVCVCVCVLVLVVTFW